MLHSRRGISRVVFSRLLHVLHWITPPRFIMSCVSQTDAQALDGELFSTCGFSVDQLMELAGLSVATAVAREYPQAAFPRPLIVCGPGNNGGDGLVAARHLRLFGYAPLVVLPKRTSNELYHRLVMQCDVFGIPVVETLPEEWTTTYSLIVDAIFGFSFKGTARPPFDTILAALQTSGLPIASVDIPSGWDVEKGNIQGTGLDPEMLISLSTPKACSQFFKGKHHYLGGRFLPPALTHKFHINLPMYPAQDQVVKL
eukprot:TRINITY_DN7480_c0_g1_i1.p1 TRINITY_DN7480_c0_g1~~TRINITY_DN7480_c0_g1_i1.p1  ORF type:complete len:256 (+),score=53.86 TRINITY_DN7480_c0_g1_i1:1-768(+)